MTPCPSCESPRPRASGLVGLASSLLVLQVPVAAAGSAPAASRLTLSPQPGPTLPLYAQTPSTAPQGDARLLELNQHAEALEARGAYAEAEPLRQWILAITQQAKGPEHSDTASSLSNFAILELVQSNVSAAEPLLQRLNRDQTFWLRRELPLQPRELRSGLLGQQPAAPSSTFALLDQSSDAAPLALEMRLNRQGLLAEIERRHALVKGSSPETRRLAGQVAGIDRLLASVTLPTAQREPLRQQRQQLEAQLYRLLPALQIDPVSNLQVAAALNAVAPQGLLVEYQKYRPYGENTNGKAEWGAERYVALLMRPDGTIRSIPLGEAAPIDTAVAEAVQADYQNTVNAEELLRRASDLVFGPLRAEIKGVEELFLSPDGELDRLPFVVLPAPGQPEQRLNESFRLRLLTTGRDLIALQKPAPAGGPPVVTANPSYDTPGRPARSQARALCTPQVLQRALTVAGSRSTLLSLWKVDDKATAAFMEEYYKRLLQEMGRAEALAATQAQFQKDSTLGYRDPYIWAAFQLTGDWRPLAVAPQSARQGGDRW